ncbi:uncharacterized protein LOC141623798 [Silene latifolia]|uniref:uncharacterized protein LOC141623798 n=1 Tax=Silene latifolia TaxID=37657 RepID=UPI003D77B8C9
MVEREKISEEEVIRKLKDDGDFDRIRLNIVRILKQNEDLRNNIISAVKDSAALNHAAAENMTPRQLCDAIHDEISESVMLEISDGLWKIIRSEETIKIEITETVQSVYDRLLKQEGESPKGPQFNGCEKVLDGECKGPPGFSLQNHRNHDISRTDKPGVDPTNNGNTVERGREFCLSNGSLDPEDGSSPPPGFLLHGKRKRASNGNDEDPDIPPGFG